MAQTFSPGPTFEVGDVKLRGNGLRGEFHESCRSGATAREDHQGSFGPLVVRDREYPFTEDVIVDKTGAVDPNLGIMAKVCSLIEVMRLGEICELVHQLRAHFSFSAVRIDKDVTWSRDRVLVSISTCFV